MTRKAPGRSFAHNDTHIKAAGGTVSDSRRGSRLAHEAGYRWIDCNGHLMHRTTAGLQSRGNRDLDLVWVNGHGAPFNPGWLRRGRKFEQYAWDDVHPKHPLLRDALATFQDNARWGLNTEWEVKDVRPLASDAQLAAAFASLARAAELAYGDDWQKHVEVKVLTNLGGGLAFAKRVLEAAHAAGLTTIILPRGFARARKIDEPYITYRR